MMESFGGGLALTLPASRKLTDCETWIAQSAGGRGITYGCLQRSRGFNDALSSSVFRLQKVLSEYAVHKSWSLSAPFDRAHRIFSELKSAPIVHQFVPRIVLLHVVRHQDQLFSGLVIQLLGHPSTGIREREATICRAAGLSR